MRLCTICKQELLPCTLDTNPSATMHVSCGMRAERAGSLPSEPDDVCRCPKHALPHFHMRADLTPEAIEKARATLAHLGLVYGSAVMVADASKEYRNEKPPSSMQSGASPVEGGGSVDVDAIEARANAATAGPWRTAGELTIWNAAYRTVSDRIASSAEDAAFIAAAREDVPALVAEVRRLRADLFETRVNYAADGARYIGLAAEVDRLRALDAIEPERVAGLPLTLVQVEALLRSLPEAETAPEAWLIERVRDVVFTVRWEQERHSETRYEWEMSCERVACAVSELAGLRAAGDGLATLAACDVAAKPSRWLDADGVCQCEMCKRIAGWQEARRG